MILKSSEERREMGYRGRTYAEEHYDWEKLASKTGAALAKIAKSGTNLQEDSPI